MGTGTARPTPALPKGSITRPALRPGAWRCSSPGKGPTRGDAPGLACRFPQVHDALAEANGTSLDDGRRLVDLVFPHSAFSDAEAKAQESAARATEVAQPALGALSLGVFRLLEHFGIWPDAVAGHSYGELTALCAAGRFDAPTLDALSRRRGRLMADFGKAGEAGAMLAVAAPLDRIETVVRESQLDVVIANKNAPGRPSSPEPLMRSHRPHKDLPT